MMHKTARLSRALVLVTVGSGVGTARYVIDELKGNGHKVGLVKLKMFRPFPVEKVKIYKL